MPIALAATLLLNLATAPAPAAGQPFAAYPALRTYTGRPGRLQPGSHPLARRFRTRLAQGLGKGVTFAGEYTLVGWGCGSNCMTYAVVQTRTGKVLGSFDTCGAATFRKDSRLVIVNPSVDAGQPATYPPGCSVDARLVWDGKAFQKLGADATGN